VAKDHGPSVKNDKQYDGLRKKGMNKSRAAAISNSPGASSRDGKSSGSAQSSSQQRQRRKPVPEEPLATRVKESARPGFPPKAIEEFSLRLTRPSTRRSSAS
jgi:hypothetical protein